MFKTSAVLFGLLIGCATPVLAETIIISTPAIPPVSGADNEPGYLKNIVTEAGRRIGIKIMFRHQPAKRSLVSSNSGQTHGELHRIEGLEKYYPNLIRVPEVMLIDRFVGFAAKPDMHIEDWLNTGAMKIHYPRGWAIYANTFGEDAEHHSGGKGEDLFKMVASKRIDIAMHTLDKGTYIAKQAGVQVYPVSPPFAVKKMYVYLHKSKAHLIEPLAQAFRDIKASGTYEKIKKDVLYHYGLTDQAYFTSSFAMPAP
ncbi:transporter substrate-binding domain-containing protein [Terasakiella sp. A23]|uniref:transporter substrate-binding domain-containing protein n=1 Tax=Terasakiella sp. FCG-A23 TaxID=3080561 RepID=UPI0029547EA4|nr:transporter substrate-binding domain-containing protein [Terasakiella sp. A23]MDV7339510.1 transporter substrate-binding domain-containing protein [Terasakiella sp. A23]